MSQHVALSPALWAPGSSAFRFASGRTFSATISALPRYVGIPLDDHIANMVKFLAPLA